MSRPILFIFVALALLLYTDLRWSKVRATSADPAELGSSVHYDDWTRTLERFVDHEGLVDYEGLREDRAALDRFVDRVHRVSPRSHPQLFDSQEEALAFYINAYNALVFAEVLDLSPDVDTVWGRSGTGLKFFVRNKVVVGGEKLSLKKLEDDWIRAEFGDPRIHAALNCASVGCPRLPREPFLPETLDAQLDAAMREFVANPRNANVSSDGSKVSLSKIFDWFRGDFLDFERAQGRPDSTLVDYINRYRVESEQIPTGADVSFPAYDKRLNRQE
ncbi:MAG: DUF547 domain-containing protein [Thermoanaerobaculia bacterium]|nr:DUF547 domain-containing protein [Thermoanaerobaculia bacterium]